MIPKEERQDFETASYAFLFKKSQLLQPKEHVCYMIPYDSFYRIVLGNLAKFHAVTYALIMNMGKAQFMKKWDLNIFEGYASENNPFVDTMFSHAVRICISILKVSLYLNESQQFDRR